MKLDAYTEEAADIKTFAFIVYQCLTIIILVLYEKLFTKDKAHSSGWSVKETKQLLDAKLTNISIFLKYQKKYIFPFILIRICSWI